jgi:hypothetical protein
MPLDHRRHRLTTAEGSAARRNRPPAELLFPNLYHVRAAVSATLSTRFRYSAPIGHGAPGTVTSQFDPKLNSPIASSTPEQALSDASVRLVTDAVRYGYSSRRAAFLPDGPPRRGSDAQAPATRDRALAPTSSGSAAPFSAASADMVFGAPGGPHRGRAAHPHVRSAVGGSPVPKVGERRSLKTISVFWPARKIDETYC